MSYQQYEDSLDQGEPIEIYEFTQGLRRWTYVSGAQPVLYESQEYSPSPIKRTGGRTVSNLPSPGVIASPISTSGSPQKSKQR